MGGKEKEEDFIIPREQLVMGLFSGGITPLVGEGSPSFSPPFEVRLVREEELEESEEDWKLMEETLGIKLLLDEAPHMVSLPKEEKLTSEGAPLSATRIEESSLLSREDLESLLEEPIPRPSLGEVLQRFARELAKEGVISSSPSTYVVAKEGAPVSLWRVAFWGVLSVFLTLACIQLFLPQWGDKLGLEFLSRGYYCVADLFSRILMWR